MKAPPSHTFIIDESSDENHVVDNFWESGKKKGEANSNSRSSTSNTSSNNVPDLLKWISDVTIKRRKFRRRYRCSHLLAEALLSNTLRSARKELALKQEEKRRKAHEFSYQLSIKFSNAQENNSYDSTSTHVENFNNNEQGQGNLNNCDYKSQTKLNLNANEWGGQTGQSQDEHVQACISSLDNFFSELKSIKV